MTKADDYRKQAKGLNKALKTRSVSADRLKLSKKQKALNSIANNRDCPDGKTKQPQIAMSDQTSKPANNNGKSIDRWDDEGGAPSGGDRSVRKRPRDPAAS